MRTIVLDGTTISIQVAMTTSAVTTNPTFAASFADSAGAGITEGANDGVLNGSTDVTVVPAPTGANRRIIKDITIFNGDTASKTIIIKYDNNAVQRTLVKVTLAVGDTYTTDGTFDANGNLKQSTTSGGDVVGPASATDNAITRFDLTTGKLIQNSLVTVADDGAFLAPVVGSIIPFYFNTTLPAAGPNHGAVAHLHGTGKLYYAHNSAWQIVTSGLGTADTVGTVTPVGSAGQLLSNDGAGGLTSNTTGTGILTALGINVGSAGAPVVFNGALGTPSSGTITNLTGTASININGTVGATTPTTGNFTTVTATTGIFGGTF